MNRKILIPAILLAALTLQVVSYAQTSIPEAAVKQHVYIDINGTSPSDVFDVKDNVMSFQYVDKSGIENNIALFVYNWKSDLLMSYVLNKELGLNQYTVALEEAGIDLSNGEIYRCELKDGVGNDFQWSIQLIRPKLQEIKLSIVAKPIDLDCSKGRRESIVEYYSDVTGGSGAYDLSWFVLNEAGNKLLFQPREAKVDQNASSMITVDKPLNYKVMLTAVDGCGNTAQKMVSVTCQDKKKKINTIFVELLPPPVRKTVPAKELIK